MHSSAPLLLLCAGLLGVGQSARAADTGYKVIIDIELPMDKSVGNCPAGMMTAGLAGLRDDETTNPAPLAHEARQASVQTPGNVHVKIPPDAPNIVLPLPTANGKFSPQDEGHVTVVSHLLVLSRTIFDASQGWPDGTRGYDKPCPTIVTVVVPSFSSFANLGYDPHYYAIPAVSDSECVPQREPNSCRISLPLPKAPHEPVGTRERLYAAAGEVLAWWERFSLSQPH